MKVQRHLRLLGATEGKPVDIAIKVAFASTDRETVNQHFGSAEALFIHEIGSSSSRLVEVFQFGHLEQDGDEGKLATKMEVLTGCAAVYALAIGSSAMAQLLRMGVQPVKVAPGTRIAAAIDCLGRELRDGPAGWLARAASTTKKPDRFAAMEAEGWNE